MHAVLGWKITLPRPSCYLQYVLGTVPALWFNTDDILVLSWMMEVKKASGGAFFCLYLLGLAPLFFLYKNYKQQAALVWKECTLPQSLTAFKNRITAFTSEVKAVDALCLDCTPAFNYGVAPNCNLKINSNCLGKGNLSCRLKANCSTINKVG